MYSLHRLRLRPPPPTVAGMNAQKRGDVGEVFVTCISDGRTNVPLSSADGVIDPDAEPMNKVARPPTTPPYHPTTLPPYHPTTLPPITHHLPPTTHHAPLFHPPPPHPTYYHPTHPPILVQVLVSPSPPFS